MENRNQKIFSEMLVKKAVFKMAVPSVISSSCACYLQYGRYIFCRTDT